MAIRTEPPTIWSVPSLRISSATTGGLSQDRPSSTDNAPTATIPSPVATNNAEQAKHWISLGLYFAAVLLAFFFPHVALLMMSAVTLAWVLPSIGLSGSDDDDAAAVT